MSTLILGGETIKRGKTARVVRFISSSSLFESDTGEQTIVEEQYAELRYADGTPDFVSLLVKEYVIIDPTISTIKGLDPKLWRVK